MLNKIKTILTNEQGMETIEVIGIGVIALVGVALLFGATKTQTNQITSKIGNGIGYYTSVKTNSGPTSLNP